MACLHGAAAYVGGSFGKELSKRLTDAGFGTNWNDEPGRTEQEVIAALGSISEQSK
jgi:hypothetical protein